MNFRRYLDAIFAAEILLDPVEESRGKTTSGEEGVAGVVGGGKKKKKKKG